MERNVKKGLLSFIFIILLLPALQQAFSFAGTLNLSGYIDYAPNVDFSWKKWFDGSYQEGKAKYLNDFTGFRPDMVRLNNQVDFSLFNKINFGSAVLGTHHYLFFDNYLNAAKGLDYEGDSAIRIKMIRLKAISDTLARLGKTLLLVHAPNKAVLDSAYMPLNYMALPWRKTNLQAYLHEGDSLGINYINCNAWFMALRLTGKELLTSKQGTHWTNYAAFIAGDSIARYIERVRHIQMLHPIVTAIKHTTKPADPDADINALLNLAIPAASETFSYPEFTYPQDTTKKKPKVIFIGDSFVINMIKNWTLQGVTDNWQFWFYNKLVMNKDNPILRPENPPVPPAFWQQELQQTDCVVLLYTATNLPQLGNGFIEQAYNYYYPHKDSVQHPTP